MAERLEIISPRLFSTKMGVDAHVTRCARQRLAFPVRNVLLRLWITVLFGHAKIDDVDDISGLRLWTANKEVVGLDIAVDQVLLVDSLDTGQLHKVLRQQSSAKRGHYCQGDR